MYAPPSTVYTLLPQIRISIPKSGTLGGGRLVDCSKPPAPPTSIILSLLQLALPSRGPRRPEGAGCQPPSCQASRRRSRQASRQPQPLSVGAGPPARAHCGIDVWWSVNRRPAQQPAGPRRTGAVRSPFSARRHHAKAANHKSTLHNQTVQNNCIG